MVTFPTEHQAFPEIIPFSEFINLIFICSRCFQARLLKF
jgi:hypothetical protein